MRNSGVVALALCLAGCGTSPAVPSLDSDSNGLLHPGPPVGALVKHISCELQTEIANGIARNDPRYAKLVKYNFIAVAELNVKVTNNESLAPSLSFIEPFAKAATNLTLSVAPSYGGSQDRNFDFSYVIDLTKIVPSDDMRKISAADSSISISESDKAQPRDHVCGNTTSTSTGDYTAGLAGDLGLGEILHNGLGVMEWNAPYDIYSSSPTSQEADDNTIQRGTELAEAKKKLDTAVTGVKKSSRPSKGALSNLNAALENYSAKVDSLATIKGRIPPDVVETLRASRDELNAVQNQPAKVGATNTVVAKAADNKTLDAITSAATSAPPPAKPAASASGAQSATKFASIVDFTINAGVSGGPTWTLTHFKGPGGGSNGLVNLTRTYFDSLTISFVPTCQKRDVDPLTPSDFWDAIPGCKAAGSTSTAEAINAAQTQMQSMHLQNLEQYLKVPF